MSGSLSTRSQASTMIESISVDSALRASGRFIVTMRTPALFDQGVGHVFRLPGLCLRKCNTF